MSQEPREEFGLVSSNLSFGKPVRSGAATPETSRTDLHRLPRSMLQKMKGDMSPFLEIARPMAVSGNLTIENAKAAVAHPQEAVATLRTADGMTSRRPVPLHPRRPHPAPCSGSDRAAGHRRLLPTLQMSVLRRASDVWLSSTGMRSSQADSFWPAKARRCWCRKSVKTSSEPNS